MFAVGLRALIPDAPSATRRLLAACSSSTEDEVGAMLGMCCRAAKGVILYAAILSVVTVVAAAIGCLFLQGGDIQFFVHPDAMLQFLWAKRAGLKVTILFVATLVFFMLAEDGILSRRWLSHHVSGQFRRRRQAMPIRLHLRRRPYLSPSTHRQFSRQSRYRIPS